MLARHQSWDLPMETTLEIAVYLDEDSVKALRSSCKRIDILVL